MLNLRARNWNGEKPAIRNAPATEELKEFVQSVSRAERLKTGGLIPARTTCSKSPPKAARRRWIFG
jgi:hypothetical protein